MKPDIRDDRTRFDEILREIELLQNSYVIVGFQEGSVTHAQSKNGRDKKAGLSMPQIAAQNEFGTDKIPARPFMSTAFDENRAKIDKAINSEYGKILEGASTVKRSLGLIGLLMEKLIVEKIRQIQTPPNAPLTIKLKGSSKPLIDFGQMVSSVTSKVVING